MVPKQNSFKEIYISNWCLEVTYQMKAFVQRNNLHVQGGVLLMGYHYTKRDVTITLCRSVREVTSEKHIPWCSYDKNKVIFHHVEYKCNLLGSLCKLPISAGSKMLWLSIYMLKKSLIEQSLYVLKMFKCISVLDRLFDYHIHVLKSSLECTQVVMMMAKCMKEI